MYLFLTQLAYLTAPFLVFIFIFSLLSAIKGVITNAESKSIKSNGILAAISLLILLSPLFYIFSCF